ncbi:hypothetical protein HDU97_007784 [Phlyctochytrium planicorne]|nr:hypothetical protein HDU97_007784 [Phlyctochytrium planicorne]
MHPFVTITLIIAGLSLVNAIAQPTPPAEFAVGGPVSEAFEKLGLDVDFSKAAASNDTTFQLQTSLSLTDMFPGNITISGIQCPGSVLSCFTAASMSYMTLPADCLSSLNALSTAVTSSPKTTSSGNSSMDSSLDITDLPSNFPTCSCPIIKSMATCFQTSCPDVSKLIQQKGAKCFGGSGAARNGNWLGAAVVGGIVACVAALI